MILDFQTLIVCYALVRVMQAAGLVYVWQVHRKYAPLRELAAGSVLIALGSLSIFVSDPGMGLWILVQTLLMAAGAVVFNVGLVRLADRPAPWAIAIGWAGACVAARIYLPLVSPAPMTGVMVTTVFFVGCVGYSALALLRAPAGPLRATLRIIAILLVVQASALVQRAVVLVLWGSHSGEALVSSATQSVFMLASIAASFLLTLSIAVLANQRLQRELDIAASVDPLTGLMNRRAFAEIAERDWARASRGGHRLSALLLDLDHFKSINDRFGHRAGDAVLRRVGETLAREVRLGDVVCRFGGEEFIILMPETGVAAAYAVAERLRSAVAGITEELAPGTPISVSIGVAEKSAADSSWEQLIAAGDKVLYAAKQAGRNRVVVADALRNAA